MRIMKGVYAELQVPQEIISEARIGLANQASADIKLGYEPSWPHLEEVSHLLLKSFSDQELPVLVQSCKRTRTGWSLRVKKFGQ